MSAAVSRLTDHDGNQPPGRLTLVFPPYRAAVGRGTVRRMVEGLVGLGGGLGDGMTLEGLVLPGKPLRRAFGTPSPHRFATGRKVWFACRTCPSVARLRQGFGGRHLPIAAQRGGKWSLQQAFLQRPPCAIFSNGSLTIESRYTPPQRRALSGARPACLFRLSAPTLNRLFLRACNAAEIRAEKPWKFSKL